MEFPLLSPPREFEIGQDLKLRDAKAVVRWIGLLPGREGLHLGLEVSRGGKHSGTYNGVQYFSCPPNHGVFRPAKDVHASMVAEHKRRSNQYSQQTSEVDIKSQEGNARREEIQINQWSASACCTENTLVLFPETLQITSIQGCCCPAFQAITISRVDLEHVTSFVTFKPPYNPYILLIGFAISYYIGNYLFNLHFLTQDWQIWIFPAIFLLSFVLWLLSRPFQMFFGVKGQNNPLFFIFSSTGDYLNLEIEAAIRAQQRVLLESRLQRQGVEASLM